MESTLKEISGALGLANRALAFMQEVEGSILTSGTCQNDFSDPVDQNIRTQCALSWKIVVSEWRSIITESLQTSAVASAFSKRQN